MRHSLSSLVLAATAALLASCGGGGGRGETVTVDQATWTGSASAQSSALASPGSVSVSGESVTLVGGNSTDAAPCAGAQYGFATSPCNVTAQLQKGTGSHKLAWTYSTGDSSGPGADLFGMVVDGRVVPLSDPGGPQQQSGTVEVAANSSLAFFLNCTDCTSGAAQTTVTRTGS
jgi:hypothetical protein